VLNSDWAGWPINLITSWEFKRNQNWLGWFNPCSANKYAVGASLPTLCLLIVLKLSFSSLVYHNNSLKLNNPTIHLPYNIILSLVDSACNLCVIFDKKKFLHNISLLFLNLAFTIFVT